MAWSAVEPADFFSWVLPYATTCPEPVAESHIIAAAREFCTATRCWRETDSFDVSAENEPIVCVPPDATLFEIEEACFDGRILDRVPFLDARLNWAGLPQQITTIEPNAVRIAPFAPGRLTLSMFLMPSQAAQTLPHALRERWGQVIGAGALGTILDIPGQAFTNPAAAASNRVRFAEAKDAAFNSAVRGQHRAPARVRSAFF